MKFLCSNCKAKYQISDEKVAGRTLRMRCRRCQEEIVIRGDAPSLVGTPAPAASRAPVSAAAVALGSELQRQLSEPPGASVVPAAASEGWHVAIGNNPVGPVSLDEVRHKLESGAANAATLVWRDGFDDWLPLRDVPQLAALVVPAAPPRIVAPPLAAPAARAPVAPIGAHVPVAAQPMPPIAAPAPVVAPAPAAAAPTPAAPLGSIATPATSAEDWGAPAPDTSPSQVTMNPMLVAADGPRRQQPSVAVLFALAGFVAFVLTATTIAGMHFLKDEPQVAVAPPAAPAQTPRQAEPEVPAEEPAAEGDGEMVFDLDDVDVADDGPKRRAPSVKASTRSKTTPKKKLTAEQKAMLERMGGGDTGEIGGLKSSGLGSSRTRKSSGNVDAAALRKVVASGQRGLKRCYETAVRTSGSGETVRLDVEISVSANGNVTKVKTRGKGIPGLDNCIQRSVRGWRFPSSGESFQTKFPVVFQPGG